MVNLSVDGGEPTSLDSRARRRLAAGDAPLYVGGKDDNAPDVSASGSVPVVTACLHQTLNGSSFHGCIRNLYINHELQDFTRGRLEPGGPRCHCESGWAGPHCDQPMAAGLSGAGVVTAATGVEPCGGSKCASGVCVALDARTYRCDCAEGYGGALCDLQGAPGGACQQGAPCLHGRCQRAEDGEERCPVRDVHRVQHGAVLCQTSKPFSWVECRGRCRALAEPDAAAASCCAPLRVRRRRLSFECDDGTSFTQDVEKPVECGCKECV
ncbi:Slit 1 protein [Liparis tanakae]|uniref:Slit 1 protein n=1 Tax=Liparis tanakae TaxID=230148 RepID=A0A4Z2F275_9TELE|nr:Slit 1 protein [Liparis tanakae]